MFLHLHAEPALNEDDEDKEEPAQISDSKPAAVPVAQSAIDLTAEFLRPLLSPENVANLVSISVSFPFLFLSFKPHCVTVELIPLSGCVGADQHGVSA